MQACGLQNLPAAIQHASSKLNKDRAVKRLAPPNSLLFERTLLGGQGLIKLYASCIVLFCHYVCSCTTTLCTTGCHSVTAVSVKFERFYISFQTRQQKVTISWRRQLVDQDGQFCLCHESMKLVCLSLRTCSLMQHNIFLTVRSTGSLMETFSSTLNLSKHCKLSRRCVEISSSVK